jgi:SRSO17 transposase
MLWQRGKQRECRKKSDLALDMLEWATSTQGFPKATVLADSRYGNGAFVAGLKRLDLSYVFEIKETLQVKVPCQEPKLTPTGRLAKHQFDAVVLAQYF